MSSLAASSSIKLTLYAATIGTPASASSSVEVPDLVIAARAVRNASFFSLASITTRVGIRHESNRGLYCVGKARDRRDHSFNVTELLRDTLHRGTKNGSHASYFA